MMPVKQVVPLCVQHESARSRPGHPHGGSRPNDRASWCKNCLTMDQTTFKDAGVVKALDGYVKIKFPAEKPDE